MAKEKVAFELQKPDNNTPVTNATEIKHGNKWLNAVLDEQKASLDSVEEAVLGEPVNETYTSADFCGLIYVLNAGGGTPATSETFDSSNFCGFFFTQAISDYEEVIGTYDSSDFCGFYYKASSGAFEPSTERFNGICVPLTSGKKYRFSLGVKTFSAQPVSGASATPVQSINKDVVFTAGENDKYAMVIADANASFSELVVTELRSPTAKEGQFTTSPNNTYNAIKFPLVAGKTYRCSQSLKTFATEPTLRGFDEYVSAHPANTDFTATENERYGIIDQVTVASFSSMTLVTQGTGSTDPGFILATSAQDGIKIPLVRGKKYKCSLPLKTFETQPALGVLEDSIGDYAANVDFVVTEGENYAFIPITKAGFTSVTLTSDGEGLKSQVDRTSEIIGGEDISKAYTAEDFCDIIYHGVSGGDVPTTTQTFDSDDLCGFMFGSVSEYEKVIGTYDSSDFCGFYYKASSGAFEPSTERFNGICVPLTSGKKYKFSLGVKTFSAQPVSGASATPEQSINRDVAFTAGENDKYAMVTADANASFSELVVTELRSPTANEGKFYASPSNTYDSIIIPLQEGKTYRCSGAMKTFANEPVLNDYAGYVNSHPANTDFTAEANERYGFVQVTVASFSNITLITQGTDTSENGFIPSSTTQYYNGIRIQLQEDATYVCSMALRTFAVKPEANVLTSPVAQHEANTSFKATSAEKYAFVNVDTRTFTRLTLTADKTGLLFEVSKKANQKEVDGLSASVGSLNTAVQGKASTAYVDGKVASTNAKINSLQLDTADLEERVEELEEGGGGSGSGSGSGGSSAATRRETELCVEDITSDLQFEDGYCDKSGHKGSGSSYKRTNIIPCKTGDVFKTLSKYTSFRYVTAYSGENAVAASGAESVYSYTVPDGIDGVAITIYATQSTAEKTIVKKSYETVKVNSEFVPSFKQRKARVTIIDDDGYKEFATYFIPIMREYGIPICAACMGDVTPTGEDSRYLNKEEMDEIVALGGEILVHGGTQLNTFPTLEEAYENVLLSQKSLQKMGYAADVYVYPNSGNNIAIREFMAKHFKCAFKTGSPQKYDNRTNDKCIPHYFIHRSSCAGYYDDKSADYGNYDTHTIQYFQALIDDCVQRKSWLVFMTHVWMMPDACSWRTNPSHANEVYAWKGDGTDLDEFALFRQIIEYILQLKQNGVEIEIVTASEGFDMFRNVQQCGDYLGYWNEDIRDVAYYQHAKPGSAFNAVGDWDLPASGQVTHSS